MIDWQTNYPPGMQAGDEDRRESDSDRDFWDAWWDDKCRFADENERGE